LKFIMAGNLTFTMIKPEAVANGHTGKIIAKIIENGYNIKALKMHQFSVYQASKFYEVHKGKPFYDGLVEYMSSGPLVAIALEKENAVVDFRKLIGSTNPEEAAVGTIRKEFAESKTKNAVHGSDSDENALIEIGFHFSSLEIF
jgi:nucleoside-diphosphate kinase